MSGDALSGKQPIQCKVWIPMNFEVWYSGKSGSLYKFHPVLLLDYPSAKSVMLTVSWSKFSTCHNCSLLISYLSNICYALVIFNMSLKFAN